MKCLCLTAGFRRSVRICFLQFFPRLPSVQFSVLSTFPLSSRLFPSDCRFLRSAISCRPASVLASSPPLELRAYAFPLGSAPSLSSVPTFAFPNRSDRSRSHRNSCIAFALPSHFLLPDVSAAEPSGPFFPSCFPWSFLPPFGLPTLRASRPAPSFPVARSFLQTRFLSSPLCYAPLRHLCRPRRFPSRAFSSTPVSRSFVRRSRFPVRSRSPYSPRFPRSPALRA